MTRAIERSSRFKRDYKRESRGAYRATLAADLTGILRLLIEDAPLNSSFRDHALVGRWTGYRECHLKPDLLLIYRTSGTDILRLAALGSHSELFG
jgi:mRNA interferase YafQ